MEIKLHNAFDNAGPSTGSMQKGLFSKVLTLGGVTVLNPSGLGGESLSLKKD